MLRKTYLFQTFPNVVYALYLSINFEFFLQSSKLVFHESGSFQFGLLCPQRKCATSTDSVGGMNPPLHGNNHELNKAEDEGTPLNVQNLDDQDATQSSNFIRYCLTCYVVCHMAVLIISVRELSLSSLGRRNLYRSYLLAGTSMLVKSVPEASSIPHTRWTDKSS